MSRVAVVFGTRPEVIKLAPVVHELRRRGASLSVISTGQHREMLDQACANLEIRPDVDLGLMRPRQTLSSLAALLVQSLDEVFRSAEPDMVVVQGDTTTAFAGALAAYHLQLPVGHVEAGLRTADLYSPFPEEGNRRLVGQLASAHFAPTPRARDRLLEEGADPASVHLTGNTVIDALLWARERAVPTRPKARRHRILVTLHRRENLGERLVGLTVALRRLATRGDVEILFPVHRNPAVREVVETLRDVPGVSLVEPLGYLELVGALDSCDLVMTDSGGLQEEAPALAKPVLVLRDTTERPEAVEAGTAILVGTDPEHVYRTACDVLDDPILYEAMANTANPFGDGTAARRIADVLLGPDVIDLRDDAAPQLLEEARR